MIAADSLHTWDLGPIVVKGPVYLCTALFWIYITGTAGLWNLPGVVVALMRVYAPVALVLLTAVAVWMLPNDGSNSLANAALIVEKTGFTDRWRGHGSAVQLMTGFFAMAGLAGVDWGGRVPRRRDVVLGGLTGIVLAASWTAIMSLLVVSGAVAQLRNESAWWSSRLSVPPVVPMGGFLRNRRCSGRCDPDPFRAGRARPGMLFGLDLWPESVDPLAASPPIGLDLDRWCRGVCPGCDVVCQSARMDFQHNGRHVRTGRRGDSRGLAATQGRLAGDTSRR